MKVIVESNNPEYFEMRAREMIDEAIAITKQDDTDDLAIEASLYREYHEKMKRATSLLALARLGRTRNEAVQAEGTEGAGSKDSR